MRTALNTQNYFRSKEGAVAPIVPRLPLVGFSRVCSYGRGAGDQRKDKQCARAAADNNRTSGLLIVSFSCAQRRSIDGRDAHRNDGS